MIKNDLHATKQWMRHPLVVVLSILFLLSLLAVLFLAVTLYVFQKEFERVHPDEVAAKEWVKQHNGFASVSNFRSKLKHVDRVTFKNKSIRDDVLARLKEFTRLKNLDLSYSSITDDAIPYINELKSLENLNLSGTNITDEGLSKLSLPNLRMLRIDNTAITSEGDRGLGDRCPSLEFMSIKNTPLHDNAQQKRPELDKTAEENGDKTK